MKLRERQCDRTNRAVPAATRTATEYTAACEPVTASLLHGSKARAAFTLLEVILAMSLSAVLLVALYSAMWLHLRYAQIGPENARRTQKARAILERIARDVRAVVPEIQSADDTSPSAEGTDPTAGADTTSATTTESSGTDPYEAAFGMLGGSDWLLLYTADYHSNLDDAEFASLSGSAAQALTVRRIRYALSYLTTLPDRSGRTQRIGLARSEVALIGAQQLDSGTNDTDYRATTDFLCDDLAQIQFEYWDDVTAWWIDSWGVDTPIGPPRAIRVSISLMTPDEYLESELGFSGGRSTWEARYQLVIPIATWDPDTLSLSTE